MNGITEGKERQTAPDRNGEVFLIPTSAAFDLGLEISDAARLKDAGQGEAMRARVLPSPEWSVMVIMRVAENAARSMAAP